MLTQYTFRARSATLLCDEFEDALASGELLPGERLPSVRSLAAALGVSPSTVVAAFNELRRRGLIITRNRGASWVNERPPVSGTASSVLIPDGVVDLATGNPDPSLLPTMGDALNRAARSAPQRLYGRDSAPARLLELVKQDLIASSDSVDASELAWAVVGGALDGIERTLLALFPRPSHIGIEDPGYDALIGLIRALGHTPVPIRVDEAGPRIDAVRQALEAGIDALVITSRAQNPTGSAISAERAAGLRELLANYSDVLVIEDDHLADVAGAQLQSIAGVTSRWVYVRSYAKAFGPDLRVAVLLGDNRTVERVRGRQSLGTGWVSEILQYTVLEMLTGPEGKVLQIAHEAYAHRREMFADAMLASGIPVRPGTGFNVWVPATDETAVVTGLLARGWAVAPGARYRLASGPGVRVTVSSLTDEQIKDLARDISRVLYTSPGRSA